MLSEVVARAERLPSATMFSEVQSASSRSSLSSYRDPASVMMTGLVNFSAMFSPLEFHHSRTFA